MVLLHCLQLQGDALSMTAHFHIIAYCFGRTLLCVSYLSGLGRIEAQVPRLPFGPEDTCFTIALLERLLDTELFVTQ